MPTLRETAKTEYSPDLRLSRHSVSIWAMACDIDILPCYGNIRAMPSTRLQRDFDDWDDWLNPDPIVVIRPHQPEPRRRPARPRPNPRLLDSLIPGLHDDDDVPAIRRLTGV